MNIIKTHTSTDQTDFFIKTWSQMAKFHVMHCDVSDYFEGHQLHDEPVFQLKHPSHASLVSQPVEMTQSLQRKWSFPLMIFSVNATKSAVCRGFCHLYWINSSWKSSVFVQWMAAMIYYVSWTMYQWVWNNAISEAILKNFR